MELTGLKSFKNAGGNVYSSIGSSNSSKTIGYKYINNLPKFADGTPQTTSTSTSSNTGSSSSTGSMPTPSVTNISAGSTSTTTNNSQSSSLADSYGGWGNQQFNNSVTTPAFNPGLNVPYSGKVDTSGITPNAYALTKYGTNSVKEYFNSPAAVEGAKNVIAPIISTNNGESGKKGIGSGSTKGKGVNWSGIGSIVTSGAQFAGDAINSFSVSETGQDLQNKYGTSQQNVAGVGYDSQNMIDANKELDRVKKENVGNTLKTVGSGTALGAAVGSVIPGLGTALGAGIGAAVGLFTGIFGGASRKRKYREMLAKQNAKINALQDSSRFSAQTKAIQLQNAKEYGNSEDQYLYGAAEGKLPKYSDGVDTTFIKLPVYSQTGKPTFSAFGPINIKPNAKVSSGEEIVNADTGSAYRIPGKKNNKDTEYAYLNPGDMVVTNKDGLSDYYAMTGDYEGTREMLKNRLEMAKNGRLPKFDNGWLGNAITSGIGALGGLSQWLEAKNSTPKKTNSYRSNEYDLASLDILSKLGVNPYPIMQEVRNAEARSNRAIDMSGGLTTGQRTLQRLASTTNTQRAIANALANIQIQNNNYASDYAKTALATGAANAQRAMQANMYDEEMYAKAHAARQQGMQMGTWNMLNQLQQYWTNEFKRQQFDDTMSLYRDDQKIKRDEIQSLLGDKSSIAKNMRDYTRKKMGDYMVNRAVTNPAFNPAKPITYKNITGKWLATPQLYQMPKIPKININTGKYM